ncbi:MAG: TIGR00282 family metallophosphoesterase [Kiritimatiellae bacterium]|nr:TIGR00282 family metallophosphoesterase [Kiritimatiellia bacterium]
MKILMIGDVVGSPGRGVLKRELPRLKAEKNAAAAVVNAENCAAGSGITAALAAEIFAAGADAITLGDHTWGQKDFAGQIGGLERIVRPANYPPECPGRGWCLVDTPTLRFAVVNLQGRVFMNPVDCPFKALERALAEIPRNVPVFVDFHAEATSEKMTFGYCFDGRVTAIAGTHTHVQTSDARVLPKGTAYITDLGMTGPYVSSIGRDLKPVTRKFMTGMPSRFEVADGPCVLEGAAVEFDPSTRLAVSVEAVRVREAPSRA